MKVALVHDYIKEFGGAERVLKALSEMYTDAPIYTAFRVNNSTADKEFEGKDIRESIFAPVLRIGKLYSPLRFLTPFIWRSMDLSEYDVVITSASWYVTRGFRIGKKHLSADRRAKVICYCHTPPRWLYGFETSIELQKYWPVRVYALVVGHFIRMFDFRTAQKPDRNTRKLYAGVDVFLANSKNVQSRIKKFYRRNSEVVYPVIPVKDIKKQVDHIKKKEKYFLVVSRLVGAKGLEEVVAAFKNEKKYKLKIVGEKAGYSQVEKRLQMLAGGNVEFMGRVSDSKLYTLYAKAQGFIALAREEDFGMTPVEAMAAGTPVIAYNGGGYKESVVDGKTGILINDTDERTIKNAIKKIHNKKWSKTVLQKHAEKFGKDIFIKKIKRVVEKVSKR